MNEKNNSDGETCILDATKTRKLCIDNESLSVKVEPSTINNIVRFLEREFKDTIDPLKREVIEKKVNELRSNPGSLDSKIPFESIKALGRFEEKDNELTVVLMNKAFAKEKGLEAPYLPFYFNKEEVSRIENRLPGKTEVIKSFKKFKKRLDGK
jgi:hypothetical protein